MADEIEDTETEEPVIAVPANWDEYVATLPEEQKTVVEKLYNEKNQTLLNAVKATRQERDTFAAQLREAAKKAEKGSELEGLFTKQADQLDEANRRADFYEAASSKDCKNPKSAYAIAKVGDMFTKDGLPDWKAIQEEVPELFGKAEKSEKLPKGKGNAGSGTGERPAAPTSFSDMIRRQARGQYNSEE